MLKLKGQTESGEWVEFCLYPTSIYDIRQDRVLVFDNDDPAKLLSVDPATIQLADDPRKAMLEELRNRFRLASSPVLNRDDEGMLYLSDINDILDEMEAKL